MEKRKRRLGDRKDGRKLRSLDPLARVANYIMVNRNGASNYFMDSVDIDEIERYIRHKRKDEGLAGFGIMHVLVAAYVRTVSQRPAINRFISGQKVYARNDIEINLAIKLEMTRLIARLISMSLRGRKPSSKSVPSLPLPQRISTTSSKRKWSFPEQTTRATSTTPRRYWEQFRDCF